ncbi:hypothetical protein [Methylobacterium durans]|uniref:hypothetical protein n=1 Tax=Methylobacterium durans TaxID=2202825 RepID=UPI0013A54BBE|nr:hypothetical protein [Methylobacterium durans]
MYDFVLKHFDSHERERLRVFLTAATENSVSDAELDQLWHNSESDLDFGGGAGVRIMFKRVLERFNGAGHIARHRAGRHDASRSPSTASPPCPSSAP